MTSWLRAADGGGSVVSVRVTPGSGRSGLVDHHGDELRIRVCSPPVDGRANDEVLAVIAEVLGLRPRSVRLAAGRASRSKSVAVDLAPDAVLAAIEAHLSRSRPSER
jgi:hypothetical protein